MNFVKNNAVNVRNKFYQQIGDSFFSICELPPKQRLIYVNNGLSYNKTEVQVNFPYTIFVSRYPNTGGTDSGLHIFISDKTITSLRQNGIRTPMLGGIGVYYGNVCLSENHESIRKISDTPNAINMFFSNAFMHINKEHIDKYQVIEKINHNENSGNIYDLYYFWYKQAIKISKVQAKNKFV